MSHSHATFIFADRSPLFGEYNGTTDIMLPLMFDAQEEVKKHWRQQKWKDCSCRRNPVACIAHTYYGGGYYWHGSACLTCRVFIGPKMPFDEGVTHFDSEQPPDSIDVR